MELEQSIVGLTCKLIRLRTDHKESANQAVRFVEEYLKSRGAFPQVMENQGHLMLSCFKGQGKRTLVLNGHLDVVAGRDYQFDPVVEGDLLYGRGAYDMLAACAVMIQLFCNIEAAKLPINLILSFSSTEETAGALCTGYMVELGLSGDFAICGEPTNLAVSVMSKGALQVGFTVHGKSAHSSRPWLGDNALLKAYKIYRRIEKLPFAQSINNYFNGASINLSQITGGIVMNQVPDLARMVVDIRYVPGDDPKEIVDSIGSLSSDLEMEVLKLIPAVQVMDDDPYLSLLCAAVKKCTSTQKKTAQHGAADTAFFQMAGIPSVEFGPCGAGHHSENEYVYISSLLAFYDILKEFILSMGQEV